jgi:biopolymer transport protein ExbD
MAEIINDSPSGGKQKSFALQKKKATKVDLTPMVDLGFLLITFFIVTTTMQEQKAMRFFLPADGPPIKTAESTTLTLVPSEKDEVFYFHGDLGNASRSKAYGITGYSLQDGVGQLIRDKKKVLRNSGKEKDLMVIIYPDKRSSYKNIVDLMDEMLINDVSRYCIASDDNTINQLNALVHSKEQH